MIKKILVNIIGTIIGLLSILSFFYVLGVVVNFMLTYPITILPLIILVVVLYYKEFQKN